jgi:hypothetical protein
MEDLQRREQQPLFSSLITAARQGKFSFRRFVAGQCVAGAARAESGVPLSGRRAFGDFWPLPDRGAQERAKFSRANEKRPAGSAAFAPPPTGRGSAGAVA